MKTVRFRVPDMSCGHCVNAVDTALRGVQGVSGVNVELDTHLATVTAADPVKVERLQEAIRSAGYTPKQVP